MNQLFKNWIVRQHEKLDEESRRKFLRMLKETPSMVERIISANLSKWAVVAAIEQKSGEICFIYDSNGDSDEVFQALKQHFAKELQTI